MSVTPGVAINDAVARPPTAPADGAPHRTIPDLPTVLDRDRRAGVERVIELARWIVLVFAAASVNFPGQSSPHRPEVDLLLGIWTVFTLPRPSRSWSTACRPDGDTTLCSRSTSRSRAAWST